MRVFKTRPFAKRAASYGLSDERLLDCIREFEQGLIGDSLGGNLYKKTVSIHGRGKRGGLRTILLYKDSPDRVFCLHVFSKNEKSSLTSVELEFLRELAKEFLQLTIKQIDSCLETGYLEEVPNE